MKFSLLYTLELRKHGMCGMSTLLCDVQLLKSEMYDGFKIFQRRIA